MLPQAQRIIQSGREHRKDRKLNGEGSLVGCGNGSPQLRRWLFEIQHAVHELA
jgi:hypothetical protein